MLFPETEGVGSKAEPHNLEVEGQLELKATEVTHGIRGASRLGLRARARAPLRQTTVGYLTATEQEFEMRKLWISGICLVLLAAFAVVSVASASAAEPALYECAPAKTEVVHYQKGKPGKEKAEEKTVYTGEYSSLKTCEKNKLYTKDKTRKLGPNPGPEGKYAAVELTKTAGFTGTGEGANLNTTLEDSVSCKDGATLTGQFTGPKTASDIVVTFTGCESNGKKCASAGQAAGTIVTFPLTAGLGYLSGKGTGSPQVGSDVTQETGIALAEFECPGGSGSSLTIGVTGSVIGEVGPVNTMTNSATFTFTQRSVGEQHLAEIPGMARRRIRRAHRPHL